MAPLGLTAFQVWGLKVLGLQVWRLKVSAV